MSKLQKYESLSFGTQKTQNTVSSISYLMPDFLVNIVCTKEIS